MKSWLPESSGNLFQMIKKLTAEAEKSGMKIIRLSVGQPSGPALKSAREAAAIAVMSDSESMHEYQDNGSPGIPGFSQRFVRCHVRADLSKSSVSYLPTPGTKPMLGLIPLACGASSAHEIIVATTTDPGYPTPAYWSKILPGVKHQAIRLHPGNHFLFDTTDVGELRAGDLVMMNYPHNPSGKAANRPWLEMLCALASERGVRLFNDAAYSILAHTEAHTTLTDVAVGFPNLSWAEAFSASKAGNFTGWRIGAIVGSPDFVDDITRIKGDTDSGFAAPLAVGALAAFEHDRKSIDEVRKMYKRRLEILISTLSRRGMKLAVEPDAGFFSLWLAPSRAFGEKVKDAEHFNMLMIKKAGVVGVHFHPYIRYAVTRPVEEMAKEIDAAFAAAKPEY